MYYLCHCKQKLTNQTILTMAKIALGTWGSVKYNKENPLPEESDRGKKYNPVLPQLEALTDEMKSMARSTVPAVPR